MGLISGKPGDSLFSEGIFRHFKHNPLPDLFKKTEELNDDRLLALVTALIVESLLDELHRAFLPKYNNQLKKANEFTFSLKISLAEALNLIPPEILRAAHIIRAIRNAFAHNLDVNTFTALPTNLTNRLCQLRSDVYRQFGKEDANPLGSLREEYKALAFFCIAGLDGYTENLRVLRAHIEQPTFVPNLAEQVQREEYAKLTAVLATPPLSVEIRDGQRIAVYEGGVASIAPDNPPV